MQESEDERFKRAQGMALQFLNDTIEGLCLKELALTMLEHDISCSPSNVLVLGEFYPWQEALAEKKHDFLLCVFGTGTEWKVQTIQDFDEDGNGTTRMYLPEPWGGLTETPLTEITGISGAVFCHNGRFIAGATSREAAVTMAKLAIDLNK